jgi:hypothetical protein
MGEEVIRARAETNEATCEQQEHAQSHHHRESII